MKLTKKKVLATATAVSLIAILSMGTLAWFTAEDEVINEFLVADSEDDTADEIFSVDVWEVVEDTNDDGKVDREDDPVGDPEEGKPDYTYEDILPGDELPKYVRVENTGHYDQYVRVLVTVSDATAWRNVFDKDDVQLTDIVSGVPSAWDVSAPAFDATNDTFEYELYYKGILSASNDKDEMTVFTQVNIPESMTVEQAVEFEHAFTIDVRAQAVQTENVNPTVDPTVEKLAAAKEAFKTVGLQW